MELSDITILKEVSETYGIPLKTLQDRLKRLDENVDYKKFGKRNTTILSPTGVEKIIKK
jgi:hypothetical protein